MDKNNEQKNNKTPEMKPKQDSFRPWLKLIPAAAVFAAVCVTCYQANKSPVETASVSGFEEEIQRKVIKYARGFADEVHTDEIADVVSIVMRLET